MKPRIEGMIFDVGGVLVTEVMDICLESASKTLDVRISRLRAILADGKVSGLQTGQITAIAYWQNVCRLYDIPCPNDRVLDSLWAKPYAKNRKKKTDTIRLAKKIKRLIPVAILSNTIESHARHNRKTGVYDGFDPVILSNEVGLRKPQKEIFLLAAQKMGIAPQNLLFIDDSLRFVKAARAAGLQAVHFRSAEQLEQKLKSLGIL